MAVIRRRIAHQARDVAGRTLSGIPLYVYAEGTTTPVTVYQTEAGTETLPQPLFSNQSGEYPGFVAPGRYSVVVGADTARIWDANMVGLQWATVGADGGVTSFQNSWVNYDGFGYGQARYAKGDGGMVYLDGLIKNGAVGQAAFTLPAGLRPAGTSSTGVFAPAMSNGLYGYLVIYGDGRVIPASGSNIYFSLANCRWRAEQ